MSLRLEAFNKRRNFKKELDRVKTDTGSIYWLKTDNTTLT